MECEKIEEGVDKGENLEKRTMAAVEEVDALMPLKGGSIGDSRQTVMERCLDHPRKYVLNILTFCLAMGNAADAVEIMCIGFIMTELNLSSQEKGKLKQKNFVHVLSQSAIPIFPNLPHTIFCGRVSQRSCLLRNVFWGHFLRPSVR